MGPAKRSTLVFIAIQKGFLVSGARKGKIVKIILTFLVVILAWGQLAWAGSWEQFDASVEKISDAVEVGVSHNKFLELLADANTRSKGICETMEQGKKSNNWFCLAFWQFKLAAMNWYGSGIPDRGRFSAAMQSVANGRISGGKVK